VSNRRREPRARPANPRSKSWLLGWLLSWCAFFAQAESSCDLPAPELSAEAALATLHALEPQCHKNPPFLFALGQLLNKMGRYDEAIDPLEGALLYRPDHWPSQLEYAIALEGIGDHDSALGLLKNLMRHPEVDPATRKQIAALGQRPATSPELKGRGTFGFSTGFDGNVLGSTYHSQFTLTTPDGGLPVELDEDQRARAGAFARAYVGYDGLLASNADTQWRYSLLGSYRSNPDNAAADLGQWSMLLERSTISASGPYVQGQHHALLRADALALRQTQLGLGYDYLAGTPGNCRQRLGLDAHYLDYPTNRVLNGYYTGISSYTSCPAWGLHVQLRAGQDRPVEATRPGGAQRQSSLRVSKHTQLGAAVLALEWEASRQHDQSGYSTLLDNNAQRIMLRNAYRVEYRWQATSFKNTSPYLGLERLDQHSNLPLFDLNNRVFTLGFRSSW
jgi:tetratricopeptide (TPR) repeat protein